MKKMFLVLSIMLISASAYAIEYSVGVTAPGFGLGFLRGDEAKEAIEGIEKSIMDGGFLGVKKVFAPSFAPAIQLDFMIEFLPFLALETGIGWSYSSIKYENKETIADIDIETSFIVKRNELTIPIMIRGQYEAEKFVVYGAVGVKLGIPLAEKYSTTEFLANGVDQLDDSDNPDDYSDFAMDIAFALGGEYRITGAHYVGLRLGYDLNVITPLNAKEAFGLTDAEADDSEWYQDNFNVSLSYRYAFNSKWNN